MNKFFAVAISSLLSVGAVQAQPYDNWVSSDGSVWKSAITENCWRNVAWTAVTAHTACDEALISPQKVSLVPPVAIAPTVTIVVAPVPVVNLPASPTTTVSSQVLPATLKFAAAALFDTNSAVLNPEGQVQLDVLLAQIKAVNWQALLAIGHTDARGSAELNQALSVRRAEAVKAYLVSQGLSAQQIKTDGKGATMPVADNSIAAGRAKNRRVEIEVTGTAKK